ncbi:hypothetical protein [Pseudoalteromonas sp. PA2MD11]|uniref:hypothetical protein n=1 Tax=Pseudoalteromonas sp. PA2MD11 TaxID=2785057 RepID=UPI001ADF9D2B|nr:hypothetical protein [Pseudoalteromonas sp. PA2MD11]
MSYLRRELITHLVDGCKNTGFQIDKEDIKNDFDEFLLKIKAPVDDLRGLYWVFDFIRIVRDTSKTAYKTLLHQIALKKYIFDLFIEYEIKLSKENNTNYREKTFKKGWCAAYPLYVFLIKSHDYKHEPRALDFIVHFIKHYYVVEESLISSELATKTFTREYEVCSKFRLLMLNRNTDFYPDQIILDLADPSSKVVSKLKRYIETDDENKTNKGYLNCLIHFYNDSWQPARSYNRSGRTGDLRFKRYNKPKYENLLANDSIKVLKPDKEFLPDGNGVLDDDLFEQMPYVLIDEFEEENKLEIKSVDKVFSKDTRVKRKVDVTNNVVRSHNMAKQDTRLLCERDLEVFFTALEKWASQKQNKVLAVICWCMFLLNKTFEEALELNFTTELENANNGLYFDKNNVAWWVFNVNQPLKSLLTHRGLFTVEELAITKCPDFLSNLILSNVKEESKSNKIFEAINVEYLKVRLVKKLKKLSEKSMSSRISITSISNFVVNYLNATSVIDPIIFDFSYDLNLYSTRVSKSYSNLGEFFRCEMLNKFWQEIQSDYECYHRKKLGINLYELTNYHQEARTVGSKLTPKDETVTCLINDLRKEIEHYKNQTEKHKLEWLVAYHNAYVVYTSWMLLFGTGYRAVWNPLPTFSLFIAQFNLLGISDKDDSDFTHSRLVCIPNILKLQIQDYQEHLTSLRGLIRALNPHLALKIDHFISSKELSLKMSYEETASWYLDIKNSRRNYGPLFIFENLTTGLKVKPISPKKLIECLPSGISIPSNAGRHWLKSKLLAVGVTSELIDLQMGHWQVGQLPLAKYSSLRYKSVSVELLPHLDEAFEEVKWQKVKSILT